LCRIEVCRGNGTSQQKINAYELRSDSKPSSSRRMLLSADWIKEGLEI